MIFRQFSDCQKFQMGSCFPVPLHAINLLNKTKSASACSGVSLRAL